MEKSHSLSVFCILENEVGFKMLLVVLWSELYSFIPTETPIYTWKLTWADWVKARAEAYSEFSG